MVCQCCVKDCGNKSTTKKKDPNSLISFHAFPANPDLRRKWLRAIGRSNWKPPNYARVCSAHFSTDQMSYVGYRPRVLEDAIPVNFLPPNSYFEASNLEVCRICLATDVNLESLLDTHLGSCMNSIAGCLPNYDIDGLPQFVCQQCAPSLITCSELIKNCITSQTTLHNIYIKNGQLTKTLIKNRGQTQDGNPEGNLTATVDNTSSINDFLAKYEELNKSPDLIKSKSEHCALPVASVNTPQLKNEDVTSIKIEQKYIEPIECKVEFNDSELNELNVNELALNEDVLKQDVLSVNELGLNEDVLKEDAIDVNDLQLNEDEIKADLLNINEFNIKELSEIVTDNDEDDAEGSGTSCSLGSFSSNDDISSDSSSEEKKSKYVKVKPAKKKFTRSRTSKGFTPLETEMQKYFDIVELSSLEEKIQEWAKGTTRRPVTCKNVYQCEICNKVFGNVVTYHVHATGHDPILGPYECPVCKLRFKSEALAASHTRRDHSKKFFCKTCPKTFTNAGVAQKHHRLHAGHEYLCPLCPFVARHQSSVGQHQRAAHGDRHVCARCGQAFYSARGLHVHLHAKHRTLHEEKLSVKCRCEPCGIDFLSEEARRVHILNSKQHQSEKPDKKRRASTQENSLRNCCKVCGHQCGSQKELKQHKNAEHPGGRRPRRSNHPWKGKPYPINCELCGETINTRRQHWQHMRKQHPSNVDTYQAVVTAICDICGKGCQSASMLRLHKLRHRSPTVRCQLCPRMFYDKYGLIRHARTHKAEKPHQCRICGKAFKVPGNLDRHAKVHSDATPFECTMCGKKFKYSSSVKLHIRTVHYKQPQPVRKKRNKYAKDEMNS